MELHKIAHPTNFSPSDTNALGVAAAIAHLAGSKIMLTHVYSKPYLTESYNGALRTVVNAEMDQQLHDSILKDLEKLASADNLKGIPMSRKLFHDIAEWQIVDHLDPDTALIVTGPDTAHGLLGSLFGTNTERMMRKSSIPLLTVPENAHLNTCKRILFATDFLLPMDSFMTLIVKLATLYDAEIVICHINTAANFATTSFSYDQFRDLQAKHPYPKMRLLIHNDEDVPHAILNVVRTEAIDMLAMLTHGRTGISALFNSSITEEVGQSIQVPLLSHKGHTA
jgi:nucleotide-binding universal stress UspA family protein